MKFSNPVSDQRTLFWVLHLGGWFAWGLIGKYGLTRAMLEDTAPNYFIYVMIITVIAIVLSLGLRYLYRYLWSRPLWVQGMVFVLGSSAAGFLWLQSRSYLYVEWFEGTKDMTEWLEK